MRALLLVIALSLVAACSTQLGVPDAVKRASRSHGDSQRQIVVTFRDTQSVLRSTPGSTARLYPGASAYDGSAHARRLISQLTRDYPPLKWVTGWRIDVLDVHCVVFGVEDAGQRDELMDRLRSDPRIESVQAMHTFTTQARATEYNDPYFRLQRGVEAIRVPEAHHWSRGRKVPVAVIDTGIDVGHPELRGRVRSSRNFVDDDRERFRSDRHGTAVAGVIAALTNNGTGIVGVAPASELIALKACWHERPESVAICSTLTLAEALAAAIEQGARVINLSLTGPPDPLLARLLRRALDGGVLVVAAHDPASAAGDFPLSVPGVIAVADADDPQAARTEAAGHVALAAPGREILTLAPRTRYDYISGSSISAAMVSGVIALLLEQRPLTAEQVRALLERTAVAGDTPALRLVNACDAVATLVAAPPCNKDVQTARHEMEPRALAQK